MFIVSIFEKWFTFGLGAYVYVRVGSWLVCCEYNESKHG